VGLHLDFETRSTIDLTAVGSYTYAEHPDTGIWCLGYGFNAEPAGCMNVAHGGLLGESSDEWVRVLDYVQDGGLVYAHNAAFEFDLWNITLSRLYPNIPLLRPEQMRCTRAMALASGIPSKLEHAAAVTGAAEQKDMPGSALMMRMFRPWKLEPLTWMDENPKFRCGGEDYTGATALARLMEYCKQDVNTERALLKKIRPLSTAEQEVFAMDLEINQRGVSVDLDGVKAFLNLIADSSDTYDAKVSSLTDGAVSSVTKVADIKEWCGEQGAPITSIAKDEVIELLKLASLPDAVHKVLVLRQEAGLSSTAKVQRMLDSAAADGRLHGMFQYHGAGATGRFTCYIVQLHNLPRGTPKPKVVDDIISLAHSPEAIDMIYGSPYGVVSKCLRGLLVPAKGKVFVGGDFSSVEGVGTAWHSGEEWKLEAYRKAFNKTGPGLYELAYANMFGMSVEDVTDSQRQIGKVTELAFGFGGGVGAFHSMAKNYNVHVSDDDADGFKFGWRNDHPMVKEGWKNLETAAKAAVTHPGVKTFAGHVGRQVTFLMKGKHLYCQLPSGRILTYPLAVLRPGKYGPELTHFRTMSGDEKRKAKVIADDLNRPYFARISTWGGTLMENVVQAICRDLLVHVMLQLRAMGIPIVLHVHDEVVVEVLASEAEWTREVMQELMSDDNNLPHWAEGFIMNGPCKIFMRYGK